MPSRKTAIYFDGYCPESKLQGKIVEMKLNSDDFWESPSTGLQITTFKPYAAILSWRGKGQFRTQGERAYKLFEKEVILTKAKTNKGQEIFPDEHAVFTSYEELEKYLTTI